MKATLLGGGREVGRLGIYNEFGTEKLLIDYGIIPGNPPTYPLEAPDVRYAILTHAHLDHSGMMPWVCSRYGTKVHSTQVTADMAELLYRDSLKISESQGYPFPYGEHEVDIAMDSFEYIDKYETATIGSMPVVFHPAGHIPGSIMVEFPSEGVLYAFDINTVDTHLIRGARPVKCKTLFVECTYAGIEHPDRIELEKQLVDEIDDITKRGGKVIIPAFAVGRTQELVLMLNEHGFDIWIDGLGHKIAQIMLDYPQFVRNPKKLKNVIDNANVVYSNRGKKLALDSGIIITTSGMMNGGPVLWYLNKIKDDIQSAIILTGYQVEGTNGRMLLEKHAIDLYGVTTKISSKVSFYDFSAHAGHSELLNFIKGCAPENVVIIHSDNPEAMAEAIDFSTIYIPNNGEIIEL